MPHQFCVYSSPQGPSNVPSLTAHHSQRRYLSVQTSTALIRSETVTRMVVGTESVRVTTMVPRDVYDTHNRCITPWLGCHIGEQVPQRFLATQLGGPEGASHK
jgi:hypothetical protein